MGDNEEFSKLEIARGMMTSDSERHDDDTDDDSDIGGKRNAKDKDKYCNKTRSSRRASYGVSSQNICWDGTMLHKHIPSLFNCVVHNEADAETIIWKPKK